MYSECMPMVDAIGCLLIGVSLLRNVESVIVSVRRVISEGNTRSPPVC